MHEERRTGADGGGSRLLALLFLVTVTAYADRYLFAAAAEQIRLEFGLNDIQLGLLAGPALAVFYSTLGISIARWADVGHRMRILTVCISLWSLFTLACGAAASFAQIFAARIGLGVGEAGAFPPAHSLVAEKAPTTRFGSGAAVLSLGTFFGAFVGSAAGGVLVAFFGWRTAFLVFGAFGLLLSPFVMFGVPEPRSNPHRPSLAALLGAGAISAFTDLLRRPAVFHLVAGYTLYFVFSHTIAAFGVVFMIRSFGLSEAEVGVPWGLTIASASIVGTLLAVFLIDRLVARSPAWYGRAPALLSLLAAAVFAAGFLSRSPWGVYAFLWVGITAAAIGGPAIFAGVYSQTGANERAVAIAMMLFFANSIGLGLGPVLAGFVSTLLEPRLGEESVRYTLAGATVFLLWAAYQFTRAARALQPSD